jgi:hypothetical protein
MSGMIKVHDNDDNGAQMHNVEQNIEKDAFNKN